MKSISRAKRHALLEAARRLPVGLGWYSGVDVIPINAKPLTPEEDARIQAWWEANRERYQPVGVFLHRTQVKFS